MKKYFLLLLLSIFYYVSSSQVLRPIKFSYKYLKNSDSDLIKLTVRNVSNNKTFYYSIALQGNSDTGWVSLLSDINSLGMNEFLFLKPIKPDQKVSKQVSKRRIIFLFKYYKIKKIKFGVMYYPSRDFAAKSEIIFLPPM